MKTKKINYSPSIGYEGRVTISQMYGKTKLNEWTIKNTGCKPLFRFIAEALCGEFRTDLRPCTIRLFGIRNNISEQDIYNNPTT